MKPPDELNELMRYLALRYVWWKTPDEALARPERIVAQVMNIGDFEDVQRLANAVGEDQLRDAVKNAQAGQFNARSWAYWHYRLGLAKLDRLPPLPARSFD